MKRYIYLIITIIVVVIADINKASSQETEKRTVTKVALDYIEGWYSADTTRMKNALSPELNKIGIYFDKQSGRDRLAKANYKKMVEWTGGNPNEYLKNPDLKITVEVVEIGRNIAMVKTISPDFIDYLHLGKVSGVWKIYNVIWEYNIAQ